MLLPKYSLHSSHSSLQKTEEFPNASEIACALCVNFTSG